MAMPLLERLIGVPILKLHDRIYQGTNGRIGHRIPGGPTTLILHTIGAKTGAARSSSLAYARDGDSYVVVASKGGSDSAPGWYHNVRAHPEVEVNVGPRRFRATARVVEAGDPDYPRLWRIANDMAGNRGRYIEYQKRTDRVIAMVVVTAVG
ncbi:MAG: nitroreductase family deazaflavin-dependent oxidoreductase [Pseudolysinimonas sp.]